MNDSIRKFIKLTIERFDYLEGHDRDFDFYDVYKIDIVAIDGGIVSRAGDYELTRYRLMESRYYEIENIIEDLLTQFKTPVFYEWLKNRDTYFDSFKITLRNETFGATRTSLRKLVEVDDGNVSFCV